MQMARNRLKIEKANPTRMSDLSISGALRIVSVKKSTNAAQADVLSEPQFFDVESQKLQPCSSTKPTTALSILSWQQASDDDKRAFVEAVDEDEWLQALPPERFLQLTRRFEAQIQAQARALQETNERDDSMTNKIRHALGLRRTAKGGDQDMLVEIGNVLNTVNKSLDARRLGINDLSVVIQH